MNEHQMADLLQRATRDLSPDVDALVAGGLRRGRVRQRRRRAAAGVAACASVVVVTAGGFALLGGNGATRGVAPADPAPPAASTSPDAPESPDAPDTPAVPDRLELAVTTAQVPDTFASLAPGEVSGPDPRSGPDDAPVVDFTWEGYGVRVGLTPDDYATGRSVPDPARRCAEEGTGNPCEPGPDGTVVSSSTSTNPPEDGGTAERAVTVYRPDGWDVLVMVYNGPSKEGPPIADEPPLDLADLERIAASDVWFR